MEESDLTHLSGSSTYTSLSVIVYRMMFRNAPAGLAMTGPPKWNDWARQSCREFDARTIVSVAGPGGGRLGLAGAYQRL